MTYRPPRALGLLVGSVLTLWAVCVALLLLNYAAGAEFGLPGFLSWAGAAAALSLAALFAYWCYALATLAYQLDRNALIVTWGLTRQVIPLGAIHRLVPGEAVEFPRVRGVSWWGCHVGRATIDRIGPVLCYSTAQAPEQLLYVMTDERNYALAFEDRPAFAQQVQRRQDLGSTAELPHHVRRAGAARLGLWSDRPALALIALAVAAGALVWLQVALRYAGLPETFEVTFPPGSPPPITGLEGPPALLELPRTATLLLLGGLGLGAAAYPRERAAGRLLFAAAAAVQAIFAAGAAIALGAA